MAWMDTLWDNCQYYFDFNGGVTDVKATRTSTITGATLTTNRFGQNYRAYSFDGNDKITVSDTNILNISGDFTVFTILNNPVSTGDDRHVICSRGGTGTKGYTVGTSSSDNHVYFYVSDGTYYSLRTLNAYTGIIYIGCTRTGSTINIYVNGVLDNSRSATSESLTNGVLTYFGCSYSGNTLYYSGKMDLAIGWNRALSASEHKLLYYLMVHKTLYPTKQSITQPGY
jgi:hypothetical protein